MKNLKLSQRIQVLEEMGIDTTKYKLSFEGLKLDQDDLKIAENIVEDKQINNKNLFRRWITAQTFKMLRVRSWNSSKKVFEYGWDAYLRNNYSYMYQFKYLVDEVRTLSKLEVRDKEEFEERIYFFNQKVVCETCDHYLKKLIDYIYDHCNESGFVKLSKYGKVNVKDVNALFINRLKELVDEMNNAENYSELYGLLKSFTRKMNKLPNDTPKCSAWKEAFKGSGGYYSLKNLILFHDVLIYGTLSKQESLDELEKFRDENCHEIWRLHYLLKETIEWNDFDLRESIKNHQ